jgi:hypothetical protein
VHALWTKIVKPERTGVVGQSSSRTIREHSSFGSHNPFWTVQNRTTGYLLTFVASPTIGLLASFAKEDRDGARLFVRYDDVIFAVAI